MNFRPEEVTGLALVSSRHQSRNLDVTISLVQGVPWVCARVCDATGQQYIISPSGDVWESVDGYERTTKIPQPRSKRRKTTA